MAPEPEADAARPSDLEAGNALKPSLTRASVPSRPNSVHSHDQADRGGQGDDASEFAWGPSHPCFPHVNPHVPLDSPLYDSTRIIRIKRDWMVKGDLAPTFANLYPEILDPLVSEEDFRKIIYKLNEDLVDAFNPFSFRAWLDAVMGVATFWLWDDAGLTQVKRKLATIENWIEDWNRSTGEKEGVKIIPLRRTGYLTVSLIFHMMLIELTWRSSTFKSQILTLDQIPAPFRVPTRTMRATQTAELFPISSSMQRPRQSRHKFESTRATIPSHLSASFDYIYSWRHRRIFGAQESVSLLACLTTSIFSLPRKRYTPPILPTLRLPPRGMALWPQHYLS